MFAFRTDTCSTARYLACNSCKWSLALFAYRNLTDIQAQRDKMGGVSDDWRPLSRPTKRSEFSPSRADDDKYQSFVHYYAAYNAFAIPVGRKFKYV